MRSDWELRLLFNFMPERIIKQNGAIEFVPTNEEKDIKIKYKGKKKPADFTQEEINELVIKMAKKNNLI